MQNNKVSVFIPNSFLAETKDLKLKTSKVGLIGRALALFEVDEVVVYKDLSIPDSEQTEDGDFIAEILNYMDTPQYLRKKAIPIKPELVKTMPILLSASRAFCSCKALCSCKLFFRANKTVAIIIITRWKAKLTPIASAKNFSFSRSKSTSKVETIMHGFIT